MIVGGYDLHLYCRYDASSSGVSEQAGEVKHPYGYMPHMFHGHNERDAMSQARKSGWKFSKDDATCPRCVKEGRK